MYYHPSRLQRRTTLTSKLHENENYYIVSQNKEYVTENVVYHCCYAVINKVSHVVEAYCLSLPGAIHSAEHMNLALVTKAWEWIKDEAEEETIPVPVGTIIQ